MKRPLIYFVTFLLGATVSYLYVSSKYANFNSANDILNNSKVIDLMAQYQKKQFTEYANDMYGKPVVVKGIVEEVYTNSNKELVIYLKDKNIPIEINCTLSHSDTRIKAPLKLGQEIDIQGRFAKFDKQIFLSACKLLNTPSVGR